MRTGWIVVLTAMLVCGGAFGQGEPPVLDVDGNGAVDALTDGLLALRYAFGFRGAALVAGAVASDCARCGADGIEGYLSFLTGSVYRVDPVVGNLRYVPAGTFVQGSPAGEPCRETQETQFAHTLTRNLAVMETEVTRQMWADLRAAQPTLPADPTDTGFGAGMSNPVQSVTWHEAALFANLLSVQRGLTRAYYADAALTQPLTAANYVTNDVYVAWNADGYRLPTEGEWEYFARAGTTTPFSVDEPNYSSGTCLSFSCTAGTLPQLESAVWFCANQGDPAGNFTSKPVGLKASNPWGLKDVHGNVWEWVWDRYGSYPVGHQSNFLGSAAGSARVLRGGGWNVEALDARSAYRLSRTPSLRINSLGFRLVRAVN